jgi:hypothetical protein
MDKRDFYFRHVPPDVRARLVLDHEASYSVTDQVTADKITKDIRLFVPYGATITDGTACAGGNTYSFAKSFRHVNAIEIDPKRYSYLLNNMSVLGASNVRCILGDAYRQCRMQHQDVVFLDPPWGGPDYKNTTSIRLYLSNRELSEFCADISLYCRYIAIKVPVNFRADAFDNDVRGVLERVHYNTGLRKMHLIIYRCLNIPIASELEAMV